MYYRVDQVRVPVSYTHEKLVQTVARQCGIAPHNFQQLTVLKRSIDARKKLQYVITVRIKLARPLKGKKRNVTPIDALLPPITTPTVGPQKFRPLVVGAGPAGLTAMYKLAKAGLKPLMIDRGESALERQKTVNAYWKKGVLNNESNVLYGEGGAGLFSDGKLTSRSKERGWVRDFMDIMVEHGASEDIYIDTHPHIGTDKLLKLIPSLRKQIIDMGGEIRWSTRLDEICIENGTVTGALLNGELFETDTIILATGHSARDTYKMLIEKKVTLGLKPFAMGVRVELPQETIDLSQYHCVNPSVGAASFRLAQKPINDQVRACYSFCMCPGGMVVSCAHEKGMVTSNAMSYSKHSLPKGNAAFLVPITPEDVSKSTGRDDALAGILYQEDLERKTFVAGGSDYALPAQTLESFLTGSKSIFPEITSPHRINAADFNTFLPDFMIKTLKASLPSMLRKVGNPPHSEVVLYGIESRSSAPLQIKRDPQTGESISTKGLFPTGEGAGYTGGIVSSGVDGLKQAQRIIESYKKSRS